jgi:hypothetical protein
MKTPRSSTQRTPSGRRPDARVVMRSELELVTSLFDEFEHTHSATRKMALVRQICLALSVRVQLEDEILFPALGKAHAGAGLLPRARAQQEVLRVLIARVQAVDPDDDNYDESVRMISQHVRQQRAVQNELLPRGRASRVDMAALGVQLASRKQELLAALHEFGGWD